MNSMSDRFHIEPPTPDRFYIKPPLPLITPRIEFCSAPPPQLPLITPRIEFTDELLQLSFLPPGGTIVAADQATSKQPVSPVREQLPSHLSVARIRKATTPASKTLIRKPAGEPGRPGSGGFNLEIELKKHGWHELDIDTFINEIKEAAQNDLNPTLNFRSQEPEAVQQICDRMSSTAQWAVLDDYDRCWPVISALKLALKYKVEASRRNKVKKANERVRNALEGPFDVDD